MKYVILIRSNPQPWGHPTAAFVAEHQALPAAIRERLGSEFDAGFAEVLRRGELVHAEALDAPTRARLFTWEHGGPAVTDGPYVETNEHLAGFFVVDVDTQERAEAIAALFSGPGETIELRPAMNGH